MSGSYVLALNRAVTLGANAPDDWSAAHVDALDWAGTLGLVGAGVFAAGFLFLILRGLAQRGRYDATSVLGTAERAALAAELASAERKTVGEIAVVVLERSDRHPAADWIAGGMSLLLGTALLAPWMPWYQPALLLGAQLALGAVGFCSARFVPGFKRIFISERRADEMAAEQALQEFYDHGLHHTRAATGVLLFVSLLERRVIVLGDTGIDAKLDAEHWAATDAAVLEGIRAGSLKHGLTDGVRRCAEILAEHFPHEADDRDEVPNRVTVRRE